jgi:hypothetical protein
MLASSYTLPTQDIDAVATPLDLFRITSLPATNRAEDDCEVSSCSGCGGCNSGDVSPSSLDLFAIRSLVFSDNIDTDAASCSGCTGCDSSACNGG